MNKIIFLDRKGHEIMSFSNFVFFNADEDPKIYHSLFTINLDGIKIERVIDGIEDDFFILSDKLEKILYARWKKFFLFVSIDESFQIIFEVKDSESISVLVKIDDRFPDGYFDLEYEYEMKKEQALFLIQQVEELHKERYPEKNG